MNTHDCFSSKLKMTDSPNTFLSYTEATVYVSKGLGLMGCGTECTLIMKPFIVGKEGKKPHWL